MPTTSSTSVSPSYSASCKALVSPPDNYIVPGVTWDSVYNSSSGWVTGDYSVSESIAVPDLEFPVTEFIFVASELTII